MSSLYNLEPQPTASCILHTTAGDVSLELWAQQIPLTCRNFLQLCLDGYYDNTIFHRLVPGFIIQGGDPTGTGAGGESIYDGGQYAEAREEHGIWPMEERRGKNAGAHGVGFKDEFHSRIKFNRRGLLGMANEGPDSNGSQFFITLGDTPELQGKNTLFGRVEGDTIYNVARMGEMEVGDDDRPLYPPKITNVEVLVNPFKDMARRARTAPLVQQPKATGDKKKKRKAGKQLLSFGGDEGDGEEAAPVVKKAKFDTRIVVDNENEEPPPPPKAKASAKTLEKKKIKAPSPESSPEPRSAPEPPISIPNRPAKAAARPASSSPEPEPVQKVSSLLDRTNAQIAELKASMKRNVQTAPVPEKKKSVLETMIPRTSVRGRKRHPGESAPTDQRTLDLLKAFQSRLDQAPPEKEVLKTEPVLENEDHKDDTAGDEEEATLCDLHFIVECQSCKKWDTQGDGDKEEDEDDIGWMSHALSFKEDKLGKDLSYRKKAEEELVVIDPREKAKTLKEEKRAQREAKAGGSGRAWDQARNDKLARSSALAGRGAK
ncbi:cyclophilin-like protein [Mollisia scopiformis]|uniref:peptidylprolyl isomerase n=1 Tax=Mollisia scopiformis TaxID=149040 RepID=A0A132B9A7_MOLSC|nr:cyclophilin-like protein [Mollisia scopiformis]KUJ08988.1 cyclophilin-like protein [Mollisia scopiformis]